MFSVEEGDYCMVGFFFNTSLDTIKQILSLLEVDDLAKIARLNKWFYKLVCDKGSAFKKIQIEYTKFKKNQRAFACSLGNVSLLVQKLKFLGFGPGDYILGFKNDEFNLTKGFYHSFDIDEPTAKQIIKAIITNDSNHQLEIVRKTMLSCGDFGIRELTKAFFSGRNIPENYSRQELQISYSLLLSLKVACNANEKLLLTDAETFTCRRCDIQ